MPGQKKTVGFVVAVAALAALAIIAYSLSHRPNEDNEAVVAVVSSLTGDLAANGKDTANGAAMALEEAVVKGFPNGRKVKVELFDDQGDPKVAVSVANRICQDKRIIAVVGHLTSGCMSAAAPVYAREGMPVVMPVPTNPTITKGGQNDLFRVPPTDDDQAPFLAKYLLSKDPKAPVAVVNDLTAYGVGFATAFRDTFQAGGGLVVAFEGAQKDSKDFRSLIGSLKEKGAKYVVLAATYDMGAPFARQMKELGLQATILSGDGCYGAAYLDQAGNAAEGTIVSFIAPDRGTSPTTEKFFQDYEKKYGRVVSFAPLGYDAGLVVAKAIRRSKSMDRQGILSAIRAQDFSVEGVTGKVQFAENGDNKNKNLVLYVVQGGKWIATQ